MSEVDYEMKRPVLNRESVVGIWKDGVRLTRLIWEGKRLAMIGLVITFALMAVSPFLRSGSLGLLVNALIATLDAGAPVVLFYWAFGLAALSLVLPGIVSVLSWYADRVLWFYLEGRLTDTMTLALGSLDIAQQESPANKDLMNKVQENGMWRAMNFVERQPYILQGALEVVIASVVVFAIDWRVFVVVFVATIPELLYELRYGSSTWTVFSQDQEARRRFWSIRGRFTNPSSLIELRLFGNLRHFASLLHDLLASYLGRQQDLERDRVVKEAGTLLLSQGAVVVGLWLLVGRALSGDLQVGTLLFAVATFGDLRNSLAGLFGNFARQFTDWLFVRDLFSIIDLPPVVVAPEHPTPIPRQVTQRIAFEGVRFAYPGSDRLVLDDVSFVIEPGQKVALVGLNGAGKTTIVKLLARFYDPSAGRVMIGEHDLRSVDLAAWHDQLGVLFQDYERYSSFSIADAIALGDTTKPIDRERVARAAKDSEAEDFILPHAKGFDRILGREFGDGLEPSIGQWQKLALARVFYRDPRIWVLDEPTASMDAEAESKVFERLVNLPGDRSVILISHRFSTVRYADRIIVVKDARVAEQGTHDELLARGGEYARLYALQARGYQ